MSRHCSSGSAPPSSRSDTTRRSASRWASRNVQPRRTTCSSSRGWPTNGCTPRKPSDVRAESAAAALDLLELELRQLPGVCLVTFDERDTALVVQLGVEPGTDLAHVRDRAGRATASHLDRSAVIEVVGVEDPPATSQSRRGRLL